MDLDLLMAHRDAIVAGVAALSVFTAILALSWGRLAPDTLAVRVRSIVSERERSRAKMAERPAGLVRAAPSRFLQRIVDRFRLARYAEDGEIAARLKMAGYRGEAPVIAYLAARVIAPTVLFAVAFVYLFVVFKVDQPAILKLAIAGLLALVGFFAPLLYVKNRITKRQTAIRRAWPDALDLLLICVESGMSIEAAMQKVASEISGQCMELAVELGLTTAEMSFLQDRRQAYENLGTRTGLDTVRSVVTSLIQAERYGTPLAQSLRVLAQESRDMRMSEAERRAAALPPKLTVPMIVFFLPVLLAVILGPAAIQLASIP